MLSREDIEKELGHGICLHPFHADNIKENSINLTASHYAWTIKGGSYEKDSNGNYIPPRTSNAQSIKGGQSCVVGPRNNQFILLFPHQTTIIETSEVMGVADYIGGALHSKVGVVAKGIGHIGTMLGPGYCGHLMISLHNITDQLITLKVGETFISVTFDYLKTPVQRTSTTVSGHVDKLASLGIICDQSAHDALTADWKSNFSGIRDRMENSRNYKEFVKKRKKSRWKQIRKYFNRQNLIAFVIGIFVLLLLYGGAYLIDLHNGDSVWRNRFWDVGFSGILLTILHSIRDFIPPSKKG